MSDKRDIALDINGRRYDLTIEARRLLADVIRDDCGLTGTHLGCEHGVCGACTVLVEDEPIRSCLMFAVQANGKKIRTVEGLAPDGALHPLQSAFIAEHGLQCGYCTPGFLMLATGLLEREPDMDEAALREALSANLCRCTGYDSIVKAVCAAALKMAQRP
jgi:aerobic carbon-monoxide dehydrogenase small subunit